MKTQFIKFQQQKVTLNDPFRFQKIINNIGINLLGRVGGAIGPTGCQGLLSLPQEQEGVCHLNLLVMGVDIFYSFQKNLAGLIIHTVVLYNCTLVFMV